MPEQKSGRGQPITTAPFESPFSTEIYPFGQGGLNLKDAVDAIPVGQFSRLTNLIHSADRALTVRPGLTTLATVGVEHHSVRRLNDPQAGTYTRLWGVDQKLYLGQSGAVTEIDSGYSGDPLCLLPHRPPLSGDPWMFVADRSRMRKVRADGLDIPIGLPAPGAAPTIALGAESQTRIAAFDQGYWADGTHYLNWTPNAGFDRSVPALTTGVPLVNVGFVTNPGAAIASAQLGYNSSWGLPIALDLSLVGAVAASDDDFIHMRLKFTHPHLTEEVRFYFVCSANFDPTVLPGTDLTGNNRNGDFYVKTFHPSDYAKFVRATQISTDAAEASRIRDLRQRNLAQQSETEGYDLVSGGDRVRVSKSWAEERDPARNETTGGGGATSEFVELGIIGIPLRRGEWKRFGSTANRDWATITGLFIFIQTGEGASGEVGVDFTEMYLTGGAGPDSAEPGAQSYDYRYTHYDPRTGAEGNPSPEMAEANYLDSLRRTIILTTVAYGDAAVRQRIYRRGGSLIEDWYFVGTSAGDGTAYSDTLTDDAIVSAGTVQLDHYQPVPTVNDAGATVLAQPLPVLFGPAQGMLFALGDPYRPGHLYHCLPDAPDHWSASGNVEVCPPSEELMAGGMFGAQPFCFSRERLYAIYPNLSGDTGVTVTTTSCRRGLVGRYAFTIALGGIFGVAEDGIFATGGQAETLISQEIEKLFRGQTWNGYSPVNFLFPNAIRLSNYQDTLYFQYQGTDGNRYVLTYSLIYKYWSIYDFAVDTSYVLPDEDVAVASLLIGGKASGKSYTHDGFSDDGTAITWLLRTACWDLGRPREDKLLGDQILDLDLQGVANATLTNRLNNDTIVNATQAIDVGTGRKRYILDSFGTVPQRARNISTEITGSSASARPVLHFLGQSVIPEPDVTINRVTQWDDLNHPDEAYVTGITLDCDTGAETLEILAERDWAGATSLISTLSVTCDGRHKRKFSWPALPANKVRLRPNNDCKAWILYKADWIWVPEPPRIASWDIHFEADGDQYYTGLDLYCDTGNLEKRIEIYVDNVQLQNTHGGLNLSYWPVTANGRQWIHLTLPWGRGHVFHFVATDENTGLLYKHKWHVEAEPAEQSNFDQNFSVRGTLADKWFKAFLFEVDTFAQSKTIEVQLDGVTVETFSLTTNGRKVVHHALTTQRLGRVLRVFPVDGNPGRPYTITPLFDVEPYALDRWETQEGDDGYAGYKVWVDANIVLVSTADVELTVRIQRSQDADGAIQEFTYTIPSTEGLKRSIYVPFKACKGVLRKYIFASESSFRLYREESTVQMLPWGAAQVATTHPFGNDDLDPTRGMTLPELAAARPGGSL